MAGPAAIGAALLPIAGAAGGFFGQLAANKSNEKQIDKQLQFQQRNADTQVQRHVKDLIAAGLNPALGYEGGAAAPAGAAATMGNVGSAAAAGVNNALAAKEASQQIKFNQARREEERRINNATEAKIRSENHANESNAFYLDILRNNAITDNNFKMDLHPINKDRMTLENQMSRLALPAMRNAADWENFIKGKPNLGIKGVGTAIDILGRAFGAGNTGAALFNTIKKGTEARK